MGVKVASQQTGSELMSMVVEAANAIKDSFVRGKNVVGRSVSDLTYGREAVVGKIKATSAEQARLIDAPDDKAAEVFHDIMSNNRLLYDQNSLEAFHLAQGSKIHAGQKLKASGIDALKSRYYGRSFLDDSYSHQSVIMGGPNYRTEQAAAIGRDLRDVATFLGVGTVGLKVAQSVMPE